MSAETIAIPITLEQLLDVIQKLDREERAKVARTLLQAELDADLDSLIKELYAQPPADDVSNEVIMAEIRAVREQNRQS